MSDSLREEGLIFDLISNDDCNHNSSLALCVCMYMHVHVPVGVYACAVEVRSQVLFLKCQKKKDRLSHWSITHQLA